MTISNNKTFYISLSIFLAVTVILIKFNFKHAVILPIPIFFMSLYIYYTWQQKENIINVSKDDSILSKLVNYPELHKIYSDSKELIKYANYTNFKNSIVYTLKLINTYSIIVKNIDVVNDLIYMHHYYDLMQEYGIKSIENFKNMQANIPVNSIETKIFTTQLPKLRIVIDKYLYDSSQYNNVIDNGQITSHFTYINNNTIGTMTS